MSTFKSIGKRVTHLASFAINKLSSGRGVVGRIVSGVARAVGKPIISGSIRRPTSAIVQRQLLRKPFQRSAVSAWRSHWLTRIVGSTIRSGRVTNLRSVSLGPWLRGGFRNQRPTHHRVHLSAALAGFAYAAKSDSVFLEQVRDLFERHCRMRTREEWPKTLDGYDIGYWIAQGCNGVIYEARVRGEDRNVTGEVSLVDEDAGDEGPVVACPSTFTDDDYTRWLRRKQVYPLAIKLCFNFEFTNNSDRILRAMDRERELVPTTAKDIQGLLKWNRPLPAPHPNIVELKSAFIDEVRPLPLADEKWGAALSLAMGGQTLYIVMKRYSMTLRQYSLLHKYTYRTARLLFGQLLEALAYLSLCRIAHRDMKSNNVLVDFDQLDEPPRLVLADFGSCMSYGDMKLPFPDATVDLGGNYALRAPEIVCTVPGPSSYIDFSKSDLWAAATLGIEIFTRENPFYYPPPDGLSNITYTESDLKPLPKEVPSPVRRLIIKLLKRDPRERPTADVAASVVALSLFRLEFLAEFLMKSNLFGSSSLNGNPVESIMNWKITLDDVCGLYAAETILGACKLKGDQEGYWRLSRAEEQLRMTFLSRVDANTLVDALHYYVDS